MASVMPAAVLDPQAVPAARLGRAPAVRHRAAAKAASASVTETAARASARTTAATKAGTMPATPSMPPATLINRYRFPAERAQVLAEESRAAEDMGQAATAAWVVVLPAAWLVCKVALAAGMRAAGGRTQEAEAACRERMVRPMVEVPAASARIQEAWPAVAPAEALLGRPARRLAGCRVFTHLHSDSKARKAQDKQAAAKPAAAKPGCKAALNPARRLTDKRLIRPAASQAVRPAQPPSRGPMATSPASRPTSTPILRRNVRIHRPMWR